MRKAIKPNLHSITKFKFDRKTTVSPAINAIWAMDLIDMNSDQLSKSGYILNCMDILTRYAQSVKMTSKTSEALKEALTTMFEKFEAKPLKIWSDKESALDALKPWLEDMNIEVYHVDNTYMGPHTHSVGIIERFNRSFKEAMFQYKTDLGPTNFNQLITHTIANFIPFYNARVHRTTGISPNSAYKKDIDTTHILEEQEYRAIKKKKQPKEALAVGSIVYLQKHKQLIRGKKETKYEKDPYTITEVMNTNPITYKLSNWGDTTFYKQQFLLPPVPKDDE